jgi:hypothetical protein
VLDFREYSSRQVTRVVQETHSHLYHIIARSTAMPEMQQTIVIATNTVLGRLGEEIAEVLKMYLRNEYSICLEPDCLFAIEEIGIALQRLVGETEARSIMREIRQEIADLTSMQKPMTRQESNNLSFWRVE